MSEPEQLARSSFRDKRLKTGKSPLTFESAAARDSCWGGKTEASASVFPPPHLIITRNAHGAEEGEGLGTRLDRNSHELFRGVSVMMSVPRQSRYRYAM